ncbi:MAG: EamA family transporter [Saprospirales bacterium]|jgi:drug/metabolite transporter (DMT)-like permease|nr:EamA family transporter [Saprospirales bacterium]MBK8924194.1 EamA family transporter [Saprospirales bacterium]
MASNTIPGRSLILAAFAAIYLIWGSTYLAILIGLKTIPPFLLSGIRFSTAGVLLLGWRMAHGERASWQAGSQHAFAGMLMLFGGTGAVVWVEQYISSGLAAIIVASLPFWFVLLDYKQWSYNFSNGLIMSGVLVGFAGIMYLFDPGKPLFSQGLNAQLFAMLVLLAGCISWAAGSLYLKYRPAAMSTTMGAGIQMLAAGIFSLAASWQQGETSEFTLSSVSPESWLSLAYLIGLGSLVGYLSYVWLLSQRPAVQVGTYAYVNPVVAVLLGWLLASEPFAWRQLAALGVILSGVLLINLPRYRTLVLSRKM